MTYPFRNELAEFVFYRTYSRWVESKKRRESWDETVDRYMENVIYKAGAQIPKKIKKEIEDHVRRMSVMPSMRALWSAGHAFNVTNVAGYNCGYLPIRDIRSFSELLYILMCGTGVGFSVEHEDVDQLPEIKPFTPAGAGVHTIADSKEGWAESLRIGLENWFDGRDIEFDYSKLRKRGARLLTMGGRSSGPEPLMRLHRFVRETIIKAQGRKLTELECHDICCKIAEIVVVGGVRRSSLISFSDLEDEEMRKAKRFPIPPHRYMANNSAVYLKKPDSVTFLREWFNLAASGSGERGIFNVSNLKKYAGRRDFTGKERANPCGEIILRPYEFCNLSEVVVRPSDSFDDLVDKVRVAVWIGVLQATFTKFPYIREDWKKNCNEERLLGVSITGQLDNPRLLTEEKLQILREYAVKTAKKAAKHLSINVSAAITTGKPSGTVSQLVDAASGCHPRYARFYYRRVRISATDPLFKLLKEQGVPFDPEVDQDPKNPETWVVTFPCKSPKNAIVRSEVDAIEQLKWYMKIQNHWCEHNQSCFAGEEKFLTDEGLKSFNQFKNGDKVRVVNKYGKFSKATIKELGEQPIFEVVLQKGQYLTKKIRTTGNHLWPVTYNAQRQFGYKEKNYITEKLPLGKQFVSTFQKVNREIELEALLHGIVFGDGTYHKRGNYKNKNCSISLCGDSRLLKKFFVDAGYKLTERDDINQTRIYGLPDHWKTLPNTKDKNYIYSFIAGWFAADGSVSKTAGNISLSSINERALSWAMNNAPICGLATQTTLKKRSNQKSSFGGKDVFSLSFIKESLDIEFFVHPKKRKWFRARSKQSSKHWRIVDVHYTGDMEAVFCVEEPETNHFVLEGNILTHNCTVYVRDDEWPRVGSWVYDHFDDIVGVSFLPYDGGKYTLAPYEEITEEEYEKAKATFPKIDYTKLADYELEDNTTGAQSYACSGDKCEI